MEGQHVNHWILFKSCLLRNTLHSENTFSSHLVLISCFLANKPLLLHCPLHPFALSECYKGEQMCIS